jgi:hypothetical protein
MSTCWVKTSEMVPFTRKTCLIYSELMKDIMMAKWDFSNQEWNCISHDYNFRDEYMQKSITHWQYLPERPNDGNSTSM